MIIKRLAISILLTCLVLILASCGAPPTPPTEGEPKLLGELLGVDSEHAAEYVASLRKPVAAIISQAQTEEKTFFQLHTVRELRAYGVDLSVWPPSKALETKVSAEVASDVMRKAFQKGAAFGCHFPEIFRQYWEYSYRVRPDSEWQEMRARGLILSEVQQARPLEVAIAELAEMALEWATQEAPGLLDSREIQILNQLAVSAADAGQQINWPKKSPRVWPTSSVLVKLQI